MQPRSTRRRALHIAIVVAANLALLVSSLDFSGAVALGAPPRPPVHVVPGGNNPAGVPAQGRFVPQIHAPTLPAGIWHPLTPPKPPTLLSRPAQSRQSSHVATAGRSPGEQPDLRTAATSTILNADGTWTVLAYAAPVHYQDANGQWQNIDDTLVPDSSVPGYSYANTANSWRVRFASQAAAATSLLQVQLPTATLTEAMTGAATVTATVSGRRIGYGGVSPNVDLAYLVAASGLEQTLMLHSAQVAPSFSFLYHLAGAHAHQDVDGNIIFTDATTQHVLFIVGGLLMYEAGANGIISPHGAVSRAIQVSLSGSAPDFTITLTPDATWLADSTRHFPVVIDPSLTWAAADPHTNTTNGNVYADTFVASGTAGSNYSTSTSLRIGHSVFCSICGPWGNQRSYLKFPVDTTIPAQVRVTSANLALWQSTANTGGGVQINANAVLSAWNATTLTWNTQPTAFSAVGSGTTSVTAGTWVYLDVSSAAYAWWQAGLALNGLELQYADESKPAELFFSDDNADTAHLPTLTINYVQDQTTPSGGLTVNGGAPYTNSTGVTLIPSAGDPGSVTMWSSNWSSVNGLGANSGGTAAAWTVDSAGSQVTADTSTCGGTACAAQTFFTNTVSQMNIWPTFTAMFKSDLAGTFTFGVVAAGNNNTRFDVVAAAGSSAFTTLEYSTAAGAFSTQAINLAISPNTWYVGQVVFPLSTVGELYLWPAGQARPSTPTLYRTGIYMATPGLNVMEQGDNGANLHRYTLGSVTITQQYTGTLQMPIGYGAWGTDFSNDGTAWSCPAPTGGSWCVVSARQTGWTLTSGDGRKTVSVRDVDDAGNVSGTGSTQIILDTTAPSATVSAPGSGRELRGVVTVSGTASDPTAGDGTNSGIASVALLVDGQQVGSPVQSSSTPAFLWDTTNIAPGAHSVQFQATDNAGNTAVGGTVTLVVSNIGAMPYETIATRTLPDGASSVGVNVANGNVLLTHQDLDISGRGPSLLLERHYNALTPSNGLFGWGWSSFLDEGAVSNGDGSVTYHDADGTVHVFLPNGSGGYLSPPGFFTTLVKNADGTFALTERDQTKTNLNAAGYLTSIVDRNGNALTVTYSGTLPTLVTDAAGRTLTITTNAAGHITAIAAPGSRSYAYGYDASGNLSDYTDPAGVITHYAYDTTHRLTHITLNYQSGGPTDPQTNVATVLTYDTNNRLVSLVDPLSFDVGVVYGSLGSAQTTVKQLQTSPSTTPATTNAVYESTTYTLSADGAGAVATLTDPLGHSTQFQFTANDEVSQETDSDGRVSAYTYDGHGNPLTVVDDPGSGGLALTSTWTYDADSNVLTHTSQSGVVTQYTYDAPSTGDLIRLVSNYVSGGPTNSDTNVTSTYTYDAYGEQLTATDPLGVVTKQTYDAQGNVVSVVENYVNGGPTDAQTNVTTSDTYDDLGQQLTETDPLGVVTQTIYDIAGHVMQTVENHQAGVAGDSQTNVTTSYTYDALGRPLTVTNPLGTVTKTVYDADGRAVQTIQNYVSGGPTDSQTNVAASTSYDGAGNATVRTDPNGNKTVTTYDLANQPIEVQIQTSAGTVVSDTKTSYSASGNKTATQVVAGPTTPTTCYIYDAAERVQSILELATDTACSGASSLSTTTTTTYDADSNVVETKETAQGVTAPLSDTTSTYDKLGRRTSETLRAGNGPAQTSTYQYDPDGQQTAVTDPANRTTTTAYDPLGRVTRVTHPDNTQDTTTYDAAGQVVAQSNAAVSVTSVYDPLGRLTTEQRRDGGGALQLTLAYTYNAGGDLLQQSVTFANGTQTTLTATYSALGQPATLSDGGRSYTYDAAGNTIGQSVAPGGTSAVSVTQSYDAADRLTAMTDKVGAANTVLHSFSYGYDANGNRSSVVEDGLSTTYAYDGLGQLTQIQNSVGTTSYTYDANHNRASQTTSAGTTTYSYDSADVQLVSRTDPSGKVTAYTYDAAGNLSTATYDPTGAHQVTSYHFDSQDRLTEVDNPDGSTVQLTYGLDGQRTSKTVTSAGPAPTTTTTHYVYMQGQLAYETDGAGTMLAAFAYDEAGAPASVAVGSDPSSAPRYYYVYNGHGDVVALVAADGSVAASYSYDPFGGPFSANESFANGWSNPYRYDGRALRLYDPETALYLSGGRAYDPALGRALSNAGIAAGGYVADDNNPLTVGNAGGQASIGGMQGDAGGSSLSPYKVCTFDCGGGGGGDRIIYLNGARWHESDALKANAGGRLKFATAFGRQYSCRGDDWNAAEEGFMNFLLRKHANRMAKSPYWGGVDGLLIDAMFTAAWRLQHGLGNSPFRPVRWWMHYAQHPGNFWFWLAHNVSINEDTFDSWSPGLGWYDRERKRERVFINDALWALYLTGYVEIGASVAAATSFTPRTLKKVLKWFVANVGSASDVILFLTSLYYPRHYPVEWDWFGTKLGAVMTMAACIKPVFRGPCGL